MGCWASKAAGDAAEPKKKGSTKTASVMPAPPAAATKTASGATPGKPLTNTLFPVAPAKGLSGALAPLPKPSIPAPIASIPAPAPSVDPELRSRVAQDLAISYVDNLFKTTKAAIIAAM